MTESPMQERCRRDLLIAQPPAALAQRATALTRTPAIDDCGHSLFT